MVGFVGQWEIINANLCFGGKVMKGYKQVTINWQCGWSIFQALVRKK